MLTLEGLTNPASLLGGCVLEESATVQAVQVVS